MDRALADLKDKPFGGVPLHLRDAHYQGAAALGHGTGYKYAHDYGGHYVEQQYLPDELKNAKYYKHCQNERESSVAANLEKIKKTEKNCK